MARKKQKFLGDDLKELAEQLETVEKLLDRTKVLYEQYFMGIQKLPPSQLHRDIERKVRELTQRQIRNTSLRYRLTNVTQKFGVYNTYWRRTLRQIEQGTYVRDVARAQRRARRRGEDVPEEILAAMPKRMRDRVLRDRDLLAKRTEREGLDAEGASDSDGTVRQQRPHAHQVDDAALNDDFDLDALFANLTSKAESAIDALSDTTASAPEPPAKPPSPPAATGANGDEPDESTQPFRPIERPSKASRRPPPEVLSPADLPRRKRARTAQPVADAAPAPTPREPSRPRKRASTGSPIPAALPREPSRPRKRAATAPPIPAALPREPSRPRKRAATAPPIPPAVPREPSRPRKRASTAPPVPPAPGRSASGASLPPGMTEDKARSLYQRFLKARKQVGKSTDVRYDDLVKTLNRQAPALMKQHKAKGVEFDVMVEDDKVILKAKPKR